MLPCHQVTERSNHILGGLNVFNLSSAQGFAWQELVRSLPTGSGEPTPTSSSAFLVFFAHLDRVEWRSNASWKERAAWNLNAQTSGATEVWEVNATRCIPCIGVLMSLLKRSVNFTKNPDSQCHFSLIWQVVGHSHFCNLCCLQSMTAGLTCWCWHVQALWLWSQRKPFKHALLRLAALCWSLCCNCLPQPCLPQPWLAQCNLCHVMGGQTNWSGEMSQGVKESLQCLESLVCAPNSLDLAACFWPGTVTAVTASKRPSVWPSTARHIC